MVETMSSNKQVAVDPARVEALSRKVESIREELESEVENLREENRDLRQRVNQLEGKLETIGADEIEPDTPDKRALKIRKWLYEQANNDAGGKASLDANAARGVIGNLQRTQLYEAMRRAADGNDGAQSGSSDLSSQRGFSYEKFNANADRNTRIRLNLEEAQHDVIQNMIDTNGDLTAEGGR
jgi:predicted phage gp36 major capsid-like protein